MGVIIGIILLIFFIVVGVSIPFAFGAVLLYYFLMFGGSPSTTIAVGFSQINSIVLLAIPLFIMAGGVIEKGKLGEALVGFIELFVGKIKGGVGIIAVVASAIFGSISGSAAATLSCIGSVMMPRLRKMKYDDGFSTALLVSAGPLGLLIPPSSEQILYAWSGNVSVLACFLATLVPGLVLMTLLCIVNVVYARRNPNVLVTDEQIKLFSGDGAKKTAHAVPALLFPVIILGGIYSGTMTPTEAAAVSIFYAVPVCVYIYKGMRWRDLKAIFTESATTTGVIMVMLFVIMIVSRYFVMEGVPDAMADFLLGVSSNKYVLLLMVNIFMIIIGCLMDDVSGVLLCTPLLLPLMTQIGISPVHFAAILGVNLGMGNVTPPTAPLLYIGCRMTGARVDSALKPTFAMILFAWLPTLILTTYFPALSLTLPKLFGYI